MLHSLSTVYSFFTAFTSLEVLIKLTSDISWCQMNFIRETIELKWVKKWNYWRVNVKFKHHWKVDCTHSCNIFCQYFESVFRLLFSRELSFMCVRVHLIIFLSAITDSLKLESNSRVRWRNQIDEYPPPEMRTLCRGRGTMQHVG